MESIKNIIISINIYRKLIVEKLLIALSNQLISLTFRDLIKSIDTDEIEVRITSDDQSIGCDCISIFKDGIRADISFNYEYGCFNLIFTYFCEEDLLALYDVYTPETEYFLEYADICSIINEHMGNIIH